MSIAEIIFRITNSLKPLTELIDLFTDTEIKLLEEWAYKYPEWALSIIGVLIVVVVFILWLVFFWLHSWWSIRRTNKRSAEYDSQMKKSRAEIEKSRAEIEKSRAEMGKARAEREKFQLQQEKYESWRVSQRSLKTIRRRLDEALFSLQHQEESENDEDRPH